MDFWAHSDDFPAKGKEKNDRNFDAKISLFFNFWKLVRPQKSMKSAKIFWLVLVCFSLLLESILIPKSHFDFWPPKVEGVNANRSDKAQCVYG